MKVEVYSKEDNTHEIEIQLPLYYHIDNKYGCIAEHGKHIEIIHYLDDVININYSPFVPRNKSDYEQNQYKAKKAYLTMCKLIQNKLAMF